MAVERVLEPEVMDTAEEAAEYDAMDFAEPNTAFAKAALALLGEGSEILDVGTGTADIPLRMLRWASAPSVTIHAVDLAEEMVRVAARKVAAAGFVEQCRVERMDGKALAFENERFDLVMCNSTIHHIPEPLALLEEMARVRKRGGALLVRDLLRPASVDAAWETVHRATAGMKDALSEKQRQLFFDSLCAALTLDEVRELADRAGLSAARLAQVSDRHWSLELPRA